MKRVLIICYYWPPAGGPGVQRWLKFVKYFRDFGIDPVVFIPENAHYPLRDEGLTSEIPEDIEVVSFPIKEPYKFAKFFSKKKTKNISSGIISEKNPSFVEKLMLFIRGNLFIPDARVGWVKPASIFLKSYLQKEKIDSIITTGPPHSLHLIGLNLKEQLNVKWIADFRDPWTTIHYHKSLQLLSSSEKKHKDLERKVLNGANHVIVTSPSTKKEFEEITTKPISVITNGFDATEIIQPKLDQKFSVVHIGSLLSNRNPNVLWKVLAEIASENLEFKKLLKIKLVGAVGEEIKESIVANGLSENSVFSGYVKHSEALQLQHNSQVLLLVEMDRPETRAIIPGKLFEYLRAKRPILAIGPQGSDIAAILNETRSGEFFNFSEKEKIKEHVLRLFKDYRNGNLIVNSDKIDIYSRKSLTKTMAELLLSDEK